LLPLELVDDIDKPLLQISEKGARNSGTPFISFFTPNEIIGLAQQAGFKNTKTISVNDIANRYFVDRKDKLSPACGEEILLATV